MPEINKDDVPKMNIHGTHLVSVDAPDGTPVIALLRQGDKWVPHVYTEKEAARILRGREDQ